jgi:hypothetical protein
MCVGCVGVLSHGLAVPAAGRDLPEGGHQEDRPALPVRRARQENLPGAQDAQAHEPRECKSVPVPGIILTVQLGYDL